MVDNFEWGFGYKYRFGSYELDRTTFKRRPKPSASLFGRIARHNRVVA
jgi:beta-glucosidase